MFTSGLAQRNPEGKGYQLVSERNTILAEGDTIPAFVDSIMRAREEGFKGTVYATNPTYRQDPKTLTDDEHSTFWEIYSEEQSEFEKSRFL